MTSISANSKFWNSFALKNWEKKSLLVKNFKNSIIEIDQNEIFKMLVAFSDHCRKSKSADGFKLYIEGQMLHPMEVLQFLPVKSDKTLIGYNTRMEKDFPDYCLVCDELLQTSQENWAKLHEFTSTLFSHVGFPNRFAELGLYLGNYRKTPFGVHVDGCGVFSFPVIGQKTFRLWKLEFAKKNPSLDRAMNYNRFKKDSTTMKASHGDMTYWPSSAWHIAESDGSFNATWSIGVWTDRTHLSNVELALNPILKSKIGASANDAVTKDVSPLKNGEVTSLPKNYLHSISAIKNISEDELHDAFMLAWLKLLSKQGYKTSFHSTLPLKFSLKSEVQLPNSKIIHWTHLKSKNKILYAFEGKTLEISASVNIQKLVKALNSGLRCKLSEYLTTNKKTAELKMIQSLIKF
jgi:hypothetical protein